MAEVHFLIVCDGAVAKWLLRETESAVVNRPVSADPLTGQIALVVVF